MNTLFGTRIVKLGDQNNDSYADFLTWDIRAKAFLYYGGDPLDSIPDIIWEGTSNRFNNLGDISGDSFDDFCLRQRSPNFWKMNVFYGGPAVDTLRELWLGSDTLFGLGFSTMGDDINNNGTNEFISFSSLQNSVLFYEIGAGNDSLEDLILTPANIPGIDYSFGRGICSGDFNGDGKTDLAVSLEFLGSQQIRGSIYLYWGGSTFDTIPDMIIHRPGMWFDGANYFGEILENIGDFNGDTYQDLFAGAGVAFDDTMNFIYFGGPSIDTIPDIVLSRRLTHARFAGDINDDSYDDLIVSYPLQFSGAGDVRVYYGGPTADSIPDIVIRNIDMPQLQFDFGRDCAGVGDINGDGVDDFAFSADEVQTGVVYIFAGEGMPTGIEIEYEPTLPTDYKLSQNFPNPFNPSTTIEFDLPIRSKVRLSIYNILGNEVVALLDEELSSGTYRVQWDGTVSNGKVVSSGVYFYKLISNGVSLSRKMVLLK